MKSNFSFVRTPRCLGAASLAFSILFSSAACRESKRDEANAAGSAPSAATATAVQAPSPPAAATGVATTSDSLPDEGDQVAATDAGPRVGRKPRRLTSTRADGGGAEPQSEPAPTVPVASASPAPDDTGRRSKHGEMPDEQPYGGGSASSGAPVLKKGSLGGDDPWAKQ